MWLRDYFFNDGQSNQLAFSTKTGNQSTPSNLQDSLRGLDATLQ